MTSTPVTDVKALFMNVTSTRANADRSANAFSQVMNDAAGKSDIVNQKNATTVADQMQKAKRTMVVDDSSRKVSKDDTTIDESVNGKTDTSKLNEEMNEEVMNAADKVKEAIMDKFGISEEELASVMEALGLQMTDLLNPDSIMNLMTELTGSVDTLSLLTDEALYTDVKEIMQLSADLSAEIKEQFSLTDAQFQELLNASKEQLVSASKDQTMIPEKVVGEAEEMSPKAEEGQIKVEVTKTEDVTTEQTAETDSEESGFTALKSEASKEGNEGGNEQQRGNEFLNSNTTVQTTINNVGDVVETVKEFRMVDGADILKQVTDFIKVNLSPSTSTVEMQLHPESLGTVNIHLTSQNGVISAQIIVQNEAVKAALETQVLQLKDNLNDQNLKVEAVEVTVADHNMDRDFQDTADQNAEQGNTERHGRRQLNLNDMQDLPDDLSDEEQLTTRMMDISGNSVDFTA